MVNNLSRVRHLARLWVNMNELNALGRTHLEGQQVAWARAPERSSTGQHKGEEQHPGHCQFGQAEDSKMLHLSIIAEA